MKYGFLCFWYAETGSVVVFATLCTQTPKQLTDSLQLTKTQYLRGEHKLYNWQTDGLKNYKRQKNKWKIISLLIAFSLFPLLTTRDTTTTAVETFDNCSWCSCNCLGILSASICCRLQLSPIPAGIDKQFGLWSYQRGWSGSLLFAECLLIAVSISEKKE